MDSSRFTSLLSFFLRRVEGKAGPPLLWKMFEMLRGSWNRGNNPLFKICNKYAKYAKYAKNMQNMQKKYAKFHLKLAGLDVAKDGGAIAACFTNTGNIIVDKINNHYLIIIM